MFTVSTFFTALFDARRPPGKFETGNKRKATVRVLGVRLSLRETRGRSIVMKKEEEGEVLHSLLTPSLQGFRRPAPPSASGRPSSCPVAASAGGSRRFPGRFSPSSARGRSPGPFCRCRALCPQHTHRSLLFLPMPSSSLPTRTRNYRAASMSSSSTRNHIMSPPSSAKAPVEQTSARVSNLQVFFV